MKMCLPNVFSRDGALILNSVRVLLTRDGKSRAVYGVRIGESATGKKIAWLETAERNWHMAASTDHRLVATFGARGVEASNILVWDVAAGQRLASWKMPGGHPGCIALSSDGRRLATGHADGTIFLWDVPLPASRPRRLEGKELEALWTELTDDDAAKAWRAVWRMAEAPKEALAFLRGRVKPYPSAPTEMMRKLVADLDNDSFARRQTAMKGLKELGLRAEPALREALRTQLSLEQRRRIELLLAALTAPQSLSTEDLRQLRAVIVLERIGSPEARRLLEDMAKGPESAALTRQARAALACMR